MTAQEQQTLQDISQRLNQLKLYADKVWQSPQQGKRTTNLALTFYCKLIDIINDINNLKNQ